MPDSSTILLVDDEDAVQKLLAYPLERDGFRVVQARDGEEALARFAEERFDLVVLDLMLPKLDGLEVCKRLRASSSVPIIMLTARDDELDKVLGLELGADDYIGKPFELAELRARIRSVLRRVHGLTDADMAGATEVLMFAGWTLDLTHRRLLDKDGQGTDLTGGEYDLLRVLAEHARRPLSRDQLLDLTRSREWTPFDRSIDVLIGRLRKKLSEAGEGELIKTVRNVGYTLSAEVKRRRVAANAAGSLQDTSKTRP
jgi:two-component system OmpR family response regulator